jgi:hypothetical protein
MIRRALWWIAVAAVVLLWVFALLVFIALAAP